MYKPNRIINVINLVIRNANQKPIRNLTFTISKCKFYGFIINYLFGQGIFQNKPFLVIKDNTIELLALLYTNLSSATVVPLWFHLVVILNLFKEEFY